MQVFGEFLKELETFEVPPKAPPVRAYSMPLQTCANYNTSQSVLRTQPSLRNHYIQRCVLNQILIASDPELTTPIVSPTPKFAIGKV
jgi:hypothetical protein